MASARGSRPRDDRATPRRASSREPRRVGEIRRRRPSIRPLVVARAFSAGITLLIPVVLARALSVSDYGTFKQFFLVSSTLYLVLGLGVPQSLYYFLPRAEPGERRALLFHTLAFLA